MRSGSISAVDRTYLQAEFAGYLEEIDRIAGSTSFNNIALLNGNLSGDAEPTTATTASTKATGQLAKTHDIRRVRREIARVNMLLGQQK